MQVARRLIVATDLHTKYDVCIFCYRLLKRNINHVIVTRRRLKLCNRSRSSARLATASHQRCTSRLHFFSSETLLFSLKCEWCEENKYFHNDKCSWNNDTVKIGWKIALTIERQKKNLFVIILVLYLKFFFCRTVLFSITFTVFQKKKKFTVRRDPADKFLVCTCLCNMIIVYV